MVTLDLRTFYLRDLTFTGSTVIPPEVMPNLIRYIEQGEVKPELAATFPLEHLREAQAAFIAKKHAGNIVVRQATGLPMKIDEGVYDLASLIRAA